MPAVRRVIVVHPDTRKVEGIISLSDVARFMFMSNPEVGA
jgi:5'-AMP-activated protein kinase, regulatory gamma subunit